MRTMAEKVLYLTYDDGPFEDFIKQIDYLEERGIKATWFCQGNNIEKRMDSVVYAIKKGHLIGNHSYDHPHFSELTIDEAREQIVSTEVLIEEAYNKAGIKRPLKLFRFPFLDVGQGDPSDEGSLCIDFNNKQVAAVQSILKELGFEIGKFKGITYEWYDSLGFARTYSVEGTNATDDWKLMDSDPDIEATYQTILDRMDIDNPDYGHGLNRPDSNDIVGLHSYPRFEYFTGIVEKLRALGCQFDIPL